MGKGGGGHGGLNILPQKSWHVYNFDAREKVRKDEEAAAASEAALAERGLAAERAARRATLLDRAAKRKRGQDGQDDELDDDVAKTHAERHINFFAEHEAAGASGAPAAAEPPAESHRLGFGAPGVGDSRATAATPWYARPECSLLAPRGDDSDALPARVRRERAELAQLRASGAQGGGRHEPSTTRLALMPPQHAAPAPLAVTKPKAGGKRSVEELRAERTAREAAERRREAALMATARGGAGATGAPAERAGEPPGERRYHAAFGHALPRRQHHNAPRY